MPRLDLKSLLVESGPGLFNRHPLDKSRRYRSFKGSIPFLPEREVYDNSPHFVVYPLTYTNTGCINNSLYSTFNIENTGVGTLNWYTSTNVNWINLSPISGVINNEIDYVNVTYTLNSSGIHTGTILISNNYSSGIYIPINITTQTPMLSVNELITYNVTSCCENGLPSVIFGVENIGCGELQWIATPNNILTVISPSAGTTTDIDYITATFNQVSGGPISRFVAVSAIYSNIQYAVFETTVYNPVLSSYIVSPSPFLNYAMSGTDAASGQFNVLNIGDCTLNYIISTTVPWINVTPISGSITTQICAHNITFNTSTLDVGEYNGSIIVSASQCTINPLTTFNVPLSVIPYGSIYVVHGQGVNQIDDQYLVRYNMFNGMYDNYYNTLTGTQFRDIEGLGYVGLKYPANKVLVFVEETGGQAETPGTLGYWSTGNYLDLSEYVSGQTIYKSSLTGIYQETFLLPISCGYSRGIEGIAYDPVTDLNIIVNEGGSNASNLISVATFDIFGFPPIVPLFNASTIYGAPSVNISDFSDVYYDRVEEMIYTLSEEANAIVKISKTGSIQQINLTAAGATYFPSSDQPEGLTFSADMRYMMILGEKTNATKQYTIFKGTPRNLSSYMPLKTGLLICNIDAISANNNTSAIAYVPANEIEFDL